MKRIILFLSIIFNALILRAGEPMPLITDPDQLWSDCGYTGNGDWAYVDRQPISVLIADGSDRGKHWNTDYRPITDPEKDRVMHEHFIDVIFPDGLQLSDDESLVIFVRRRNQATCQPTAFEIRGCTDPAVADRNLDYEALSHFDWGDKDSFRYAYFTYRGVDTDEYSARIPVDPSKKYYRLRFTLKANNSKTFSPSGFRRMMISRFQIYKLGPDDSYPNGLADRFHLKTDMYYDYADFKLNRTGGILDPKVRKGVSGLDDWVGAKPGLTVDGKWTDNPDFFQNHADKLSKPDYTLVSRANDPRIKTDVKYQATHVTEHELYAIPGDAVALYPFYNYNTVDAYKEVFSHWYDYETGGHLTDGKGTRVLDFLIDPSGIAINNDAGWFGGTAMQYNSKSSPVPGTDSKTYQISTVDDYKAFMNACNGGESRAVGILNADLDFTGVTDIVPIGTYDMPFIGCFNGQGHTIRNLVISQPETKGVGMFGWVAAGTVIENVIFDKNCHFTGLEYVGPVGAVNGKYDALGDKSVTLYNIINHGTVEGIGSDTCLGGIFGSARENTGTKMSMKFSNCAFTGTIIGTHADGLISGWICGGSNVHFENCFTTGKFANASYLVGKPFFCPDNDSQLNFDKCFSSFAKSHTVELIDAGVVNTPEFIAQLGGNWRVQEGADFPTLEWNSYEPGDIQYATESGNRLYGTIATFFYPRDVTQHQLQDFPQDDYYIAADFSQSMDFASYCDIEHDSIREPLINFRHIFHIKSGKKFADDNCSTKEKNDAYIRKNKRHITAEAGVPFQIRFDSPIPVQHTTRSRLYYKIDDTDYRRVCSMRIRVIKDGVILKEITDKDNLTDTLSTFYAAEVFSGYGTRKIKDIDNPNGEITYYACGGGGSYYRMLACKKQNAIEGTYTVQIVGLDYNGEIIRIPDGSNAELLIQEFEITFLPKTAATLVRGSEIDKPNSPYTRMTNKWLSDNYGAARDIIDYDEYMLYHELPATERSKYQEVNNNGTVRVKWPLEWATTGYSFGYNNHFDFNMYEIANHSSVVGYNAAAQNYPAENNFGAGIKGLFDRKFYETQGAQKGYFYYVNAAADPGVMGYLHLNDFCAGSTVHVTGWVSEFSAVSETANLALNFIAVLKNGDRVPLHTHTTGYVQPEDQGHWMYFYASFVPIFTDKDFDLNDVDHYEIELDNNCKNSGGADYAIDDLRVYLVKPLVYADLPKPICEKVSQTDVKISAPFDVLMQSLGQAPAADPEHGQQLNLYYSFVDYKAFSDLIANGKSTDEAFEKAVLRYNYRGVNNDNNGETGDSGQTGKNDTYFGKISFDTYFPKNPAYHDAEEVLDSNAYGETVNGTQMITFNTRPYDRTMTSGKEYLVVLYLPTKDEQFADGQGPTAAQYQIGSIGTSNDCSKSCVFRVMGAHRIKIDGSVMNPNEIIESCRNQSPIVQVDLYGQFGDSIKLVEANARFDWFVGSMEDFALAAETIDNTKVFLWDALTHFRDSYPAASSVKGCKIIDKYTQADSIVIEKYAYVDPEGNTRPRLLLGQSSYVFPPLVLENNQTERQEYVLAVPIPVESEDETKQYLVCGQPTEVRVTVRQRAPRLKHGLTNIQYPAAIDDVPLRVSLSEIEKTSTESNARDVVTKHDYMLEIPIYDLRVVSDGVTGMRMPGGGSPIFIAQTDDPEYKGLDFESPVGELRSLTAETAGTSNLFTAVFYRNRITFKEGYTYRFRFTFEENNTAVGADEVCIGHDVFTIKVVPEYQKWTGKVNLNWNNDGNWRRVKSEEMHAEASKFTTDGSNTNPSSFAPLDFTNVIIPSTDTIPNLFPESTVDVLGFKWANKPSENKLAGDATVLVQYDMAQLLKPGTKGLFCRPWYAHTCNHIHFESQSQISGQHYLHYDSAWVDIEMDPSLWLTASSPLQGVVAGDMYLPTAGARQLTTYFKNINFDPDVNNRFAPAVFQRSWNQASATVYKYPNHDNDTEDVTVRTTWSHVYNDVRVPYSPGHGFSVRNDVSKYAADNKPEKVLFRLPKADSFYDYYTTDGMTGDKTTINRTNPARLGFDETTPGGKFTAIIEAATDQNQFFLVGNPFIAHLNMVEFFNDNPDIEAKYWILTGALQGAAVMSPDGVMLGSTGDTPNYLPPMTGFFVQAKEGKAGKQLKVNFTADMMDYPSFKPQSRAAAAIDEAPAGLMITAVESGSTAVVFTSEMAETRYDDAEDALFIQDSTLGEGAGVYTRVDGHAMTVNFCPEVEGTEVGLTADETSTTTLRFTGVDEAEGLMLYDAAEGDYYPLAEGTEVTIRGAAKDRLYIVSDRIDVAHIGISMSLEGRQLTVTSPVGGLTVSIYNTMGMNIDAYDDGDTTATFTLEPGIYIVEAKDDENTLTRKFLVR